LGCSRIQLATCLFKVSNLEAASLFGIQVLLRENRFTLVGERPAACEREPGLCHEQRSPLNFNGELLFLPLASDSAADSPRLVGRTMTSFFSDVSY
jgi:hypothetical protein